MSSRHKSQPQPLKWTEWSWDADEGRFYRYAKDKKGETHWEFQEPEEETKGPGNPRTSSGAIDNLSESLHDTSIQESQYYTTSASGDNYGSSPPAASDSKGKDRAYVSSKHRTGSRTSSSRTSTKDKVGGSSSSRPSVSSGKLSSSRAATSTSKHHQFRPVDESIEEDEPCQDVADDSQQQAAWSYGKNDYQTPLGQASTQPGRAVPQQSAVQADFAASASLAAIYTTDFTPSDATRATPLAAASQGSLEPELSHSTQPAAAYGANYAMAEQASYGYDERSPSKDRSLGGGKPGKRNFGTSQNIGSGQLPRNPTIPPTKIKTSYPVQEVAEDSTYSAPSRHGKRAAGGRRREDPPQAPLLQQPVSQNTPYSQEGDLDAEEDAEYLAALEQSKQDYLQHPRAGESSTSAGAAYEEPDDDDDGLATPRALTPERLDIRGTLGEEERLDPRYRVEASVMFQPGEVFKVLWSEPQGAGGVKSASHRSVTELEVREYFGQRFYVSFRRFVVVANDEGHCTCVPVLTYGGKGCTKSGAKPSKHGIIFQHGRNPHMVKNEPKLGFRPVAMEIDAAGEKLARESRVNYAKLMTIEHNVKVFFIGRITQQDFGTVSSAVDHCWQAKMKKSQRKRT